MPLSFLNDPYDSHHWVANGRMAQYDIRQYSDLDFTLSWAGQQRQFGTLLEAVNAAEAVEHPAAPAPAAASIPLTAEQPPFAHVIDIPCPTCGRGTGEVCQRSDGTRARGHHAARVNAYTAARDNWRKAQAALAP